MKALVLEKQLELQLRDIDLPTEVGPDAVSYTHLTLPTKDSV